MGPTQDGTENARARSLSGPRQSEGDGPENNNVTNLLEKKTQKIRKLWMRACFAVNVTTG